ncbi:MAG TPA: hypothetical protein VK338_04195 [Candidatus Nitrosocosmicus sp.]|nr:hypothetical protein [Candidatus Nitrosocosmicus sp.]
MYRKIALIISLIIVLILGFILYKKINTPQKVHLHAGFKIFVDGKLQDFSDFKYMSLVPCGDTEVKHNEQIEKAHLHDNIGTVVHVHREGAKWKDLFRNINYSIDTSKNVEAYLNGKQINNILDQKIKEYDSIILLIGKKPNKYLDQAVTKKEIKAVENKSELCGT